MLGGLEGIMNLAAASGEDLDSALAVFSASVIAFSEAMLKVTVKLADVGLALVVSLVQYLVSNASRLRFSKNYSSGPDSPLPRPPLPSEVFPNNHKS